MMSSPLGLRPRRFFLVVLATALLVELAWVLAVPAFRGIDEFDHVYKAESVAHGHFRGQNLDAPGPGPYVEVPPDVVAAAARRCRSYDYTAADTCRPAAVAGEGLVFVRSGAASYNPAYYALVGPFARPFHGSSVVFVLRAITALLSAALLAAAAYVTTTWARTAWPLLALVVAATPVLTYSGAVVSPNGIGYAAGCLLWSSLLGARAANRPLHLISATFAGIVVLVTHSTGFFWLAVVSAAVAALAPWSHWRTVTARHPRRSFTMLLLLTLGVLGTLAWIIVNKTNAPPTAASTRFGPMPWDQLPAQVILWTAQTIAAFPLRNDPAPYAVYGMWLVPFLFLMALGLRHAGRRVRFAVAGLVLVWLVVPVVASLLSHDALGFAWQGRYALVLSVGLPALAGFALDQRGAPLPRWLVALVVAVCATAHAISVGGVAAREAHTPLAPDFAAAVPGGPWLLAAIALVGCLLPLAAAKRASLPSQAAETRVTESVSA